MLFLSFTRIWELAAVGNTVVTSYTHTSFSLKFQIVWIQPRREQFSLLLFFFYCCFFFSLLCLTTNTFQFSSNKTNRKYETSFFFYSKAKLFFFFFSVNTPWSLNWRSASIRSFLAEKEQRAHRRVSTSCALRHTFFFCLSESGACPDSLTHARTHTHTHTYQKKKKSKHINRPKIRNQQNIKKRKIAVFCSG